MLHVQNLCHQVFCTYRILIVRLSRHQYLRIHHGARTIFRDVFAGIDDDLNEQLEFGKYKKLGDTSSVREAF